MLAAYDDSAGGIARNVDRIHSAIAQHHFRRAVMTG